MNNYFYQRYFILLLAFIHVQVVFSSDLEKKCDQVANRLLYAVTMTHIDRYGDALCKKDFRQLSSSILYSTYKKLDQSNTRGNCCAVAFVDEKLQEYYLGYDMLPHSIAELADTKVIDGKNIAVFFNGGSHFTNSKVVTMFNDHYRMLYPLQGIPVNPYEGRQTDAEERLLLALNDQQVQTKLKPKKWNTMVFVSSMDTCKYCALSLSGFLMHQQKLSFSGKSSYHIRNIKVYFPFAYEDPIMKNTITSDSHIMLLPPHVEHIQFNYRQTLNTIFLTALEKIRNGESLLRALLSQLQGQYVFENEFIKRLLNQKEIATKVVQFPGFIPIFERFLSNPERCLAFANLLNSNPSVILDQEFFRNPTIKGLIQKYVSDKWKPEVLEAMKKLGIL